MHCRLVLYVVGELIAVGVSIAVSDNGYSMYRYSIIDALHVYICSKNIGYLIFIHLKGSFIIIRRICVQLRHSCDRIERKVGETAYKSDKLWRMSV